jgi:hypothetical protein
MLEAQGHRTRYTALVMHGDEATSKKHEEMGFYQGWGTVLDQLVALAKTFLALAGCCNWLRRNCSGDPVRVTTTNVGQKKAGRERSPTPPFD